MSRCPHAPTEERPVLDEAGREGMTYDWNGQTHEVLRPEWSDDLVASRVRMLRRTDLDHEFICCLGRDRIMGLSKEVARLKAELAKAQPKKGWKLLPEDLETHLGDFHDACVEAQRSAAREAEKDTSDYWLHQVVTIKKVRDMIAAEKG